MLVACKVAVSDGRRATEEAEIDNFVAITSDLGYH